VHVQQDFFDKNTAGETPVCESGQPTGLYIVIQSMLQKYKSLEQAQTINQQLNTVNAATSKKEKI
jgi:hypothetical protein